MILGVGSMDYPAEFQGTSQDTLNKLGVSKVMTLTSTYDHRVIQGAASGEFLRIMSQLLLGENDFFDDIFAVAAHPVRAGPLAHRHRRRPTTTTSPRPPGSSS